MDSGYAVEVAVNIFLQNLGTWSYGIMKAFSFLGQEEFFLVLLPFLYWCVDSRIGIRIGIMLLVSTGVNGFFKTLFAGPRPYWFKSEVLGVTGESSFGVPSGHAQIAASVWGYLAVLFRKKWFSILAIVVVFLIGLSRLFLGVHFLRDVLVGWLIGGILIYLFVKLEPAFVRFINNLSYNKKIGYIFAGSAIFMVVLLTPTWLRVNFLVPQEWITNALADIPDVSPQPLAIDGIFTVVGTLLGMLLGYTWLTQKYGGMSTAGKPVIVLGRYLLGLVGLVVLWFGLGKIFPSNEDLISYILRLLRYTIIGLWVSGFAPWIFMKLKLASPQQKKSFKKRH